MLIKNVTILHCHGNRYFNIHMGFLNSNTLFSPYATEAVDVSSVDLGDVCFLRASFFWNCLAIWPWLAWSLPCRPCSQALGSSERFHCVIGSMPFTHDTAEFHGRGSARIKTVHFISDRQGGRKALGTMHSLQRRAPTGCFLQPEPIFWVRVSCSPCWLQIC